jgi:hypothetical protein
VKKPSLGILVGVVLPGLGVVVAIVAWLWPVPPPGQDHKKPGIYAVRVQVLDPQGNPVSGAKVYASAGNEPHLLPNGWWEIQVPSAKVPMDGHLGVWAEHQDWTTNRIELLLAEDANPSVEIRLKQPRTQLRGRVLDRDGRTLAGVRVSTQDGGSGEVTSKADGSFELELPVPPGTRVSLRAEHPRWAPRNDVFCYAGGDTCSITLDRR